jgi:hypothetical protein
LNEHDPAIDSSVVAEASADVTAPDDRSLTDDIMALVDDGKTYVEAELQYQKSRAAAGLAQGRSGAGYGLVAAALLHLALVALVVGSVFALAPAIGAWAATAVVVGLLILAGMGFALAAKRRFARLAAIFGEPKA